MADEFEDKVWEGDWGIVIKPPPEEWTAMVFRPGATEADETFFGSGRDEVLSRARTHILMSKRVTRHRKPVAATPAPEPEAAGPKVP